MKDKLTLYRDRPYHPAVRATGASANMQTARQTVQFFMHDCREKSCCFSVRTLYVRKMLMDTRVVAGWRGDGAEPLPGGSMTAPARGPICFAQMRRAVRCDDRTAPHSCSPTRRGPRKRSALSKAERNAYLHLWQPHYAAKSIVQVPTAPATAVPSMRERRRRWPPPRLFQPA